MMHHMKKQRSDNLPFSHAFSNRAAQHDRADRGCRGLSASGSSNSSAVAASRSTASSSSASSSSACSSSSATAGGDDSSTSSSSSSSSAFDRHMARKRSPPRGVPPSSIPPRGVTDIDGPQFLTPSYDPAYGRSIWVQQRKQELLQDETSPDWSTPSSLAPGPPAKASVPFTVRQPELDEGIRCALLEWLAEVSLEYKMQLSTYFLAVRLLDRVLLQLPIKKTKFQLLGCACLMIAGKLEEIEAPTIENLVFLSDSSFDVESLVVMEHTVLQMLAFKISVHTSHYFASRLAMAAEMTDKEKSFMYFLLEISLYDFSLSRELISMVAAAAAHLTIQALRSLDSPVWTPSLEHYSGYDDSDPLMRDLVVRLSQLHWQLESSPYSGLAKKYAKASMHKVSLTGAVRQDKLRYSVPPVRGQGQGMGVVMSAGRGTQTRPIPLFFPYSCEGGTERESERESAREEVSHGQHTQVHGQQTRQANPILPTLNCGNNSNDSDINISQSTSQNNNTTHTHNTHKSHKHNTHDTRPNANDNEPNSRPNNRAPNYRAPNNRAPNNRATNDRAPAELSTVGVRTDIIPSVRLSVHFSNSESRDSIDSRESMERRDSTDVDGDGSNCDDGHRAASLSDRCGADTIYGNADTHQACGTEGEEGHGDRLTCTVTATDDVSKPTVAVGTQKRVMGVEEGTERGTGTERGIGRGTGETCHLVELSSVKAPTQTALTLTRAPSSMLKYWHSPSPSHVDASAVCTGERDEREAGQEAEEREEREEMEGGEVKTMDLSLNMDLALEEGCSLLSSPPLSHISAPVPRGRGRPKTDKGTDKGAEKAQRTKIMAPVTMTATKRVSTGRRVIIGRACK